jgi:tetratricopeptide (TPR) repeat protein
MQRRTIPLLALAVCAGLMTASAAAATQHHGQHGKVAFATSCSEAANAHIQTGLALVHHMMYDQAEPEFLAAAAADAGCAMAQWGLAMTQLRPLWAPPTRAEFDKGRAAVLRARELDAPTPREQQYVEAIAAYFDDVPSVDHRTRVRAWHAAHRALHEAHPDDVDAGALYALSLLATAPPDDREFRQQAAAGALLEELHSRAPEHPGVFHYLIHAYDNPLLASRAVEVARAYDQLAPDVPHALHMPSHIFVRLGMWPDVVAWNERSAAAALRQPVGNATSLHHAHAIDYALYAELQQGRDEAARKLLGQIAAVDNYQHHDAGAYAIAAAPARFALERGDWVAAAELPARTHGAFSWDDYPHHESITHFARGLGAARSGDVEAARVSLAKIEDLQRRTVDAGEQYWSVLVDARRQTVMAWIAFADGSHDAALRHMQAAADREDSVDKHPITPSAVRPARELLGDMLVALGDPEAAIEAYETALAVSPRRLNSLYGAGRAAELAGLDQLARSYYERIAALTADDAEREDLHHVRAFLAGS